jgi:hypothetical protein
VDHLPAITEEELVLQKSKNELSFLSLPPPVSTVFVNSLETLEIIAKDFQFHLCSLEEIVSEVNSNNSSNSSTSNKMDFSPPPPHLSNEISIKKIILDNLIKYLRAGKCSIEEDGGHSLLTSKTDQVNLFNPIDDELESVTTTTVEQTSIDEQPKRVYTKVVGLDSEWAVSRSIQSVADILQVCIFFSVSE